MDFQFDEFDQFTRVMAPFITFIKAFSQASKSDQIFQDDAAICINRREVKHQEELERRSSKRLIQSQEEREGKRKQHLKAGCMRMKGFGRKDLSSRAEQKKGEPVSESSGYFSFCQ